MADDIDFERYVRTPFAVEATLITEDNIDEVAKLVGEVKTKNGEKFIVLDRRIVPNVGKAFQGWYLTRLGVNLRCYSPKVFKEQFMALPENGQATFTFSDPDDDGAATLVN